MVELTRGWVMLSDQQERAGGEVERNRRRTPDSGGREGVYALAVGGVCIAIMFVLVGVPVVGLAVGGVTALAVIAVALLARPEHRLRRSLRAVEGRRQGRRRGRSRST